MAYPRHHPSHLPLSPPAKNRWPSLSRDGYACAVCCREITARTNRAPDELYRDLTLEFGDPIYERIEAPATPDEKKRLEKLSVDQVSSKGLAGEKIQSILTHAPGHNAPIGGLKVIAESSWFAARPSGTEMIYKIYAESFKSEDHLRQVQQEAEAIVSAALNDRKGSKFGMVQACCLSSSCVSKLRK